MVSKSKFIGVGVHSNIALLIALCATSCGPITEAQKADALAEQYSKLSKSSEKCSFAPKVADAYARAGDGPKVQEWQHNEKIDCLIVGASHSVGDYSD